MAALAIGVMTLVTGCGSDATTAGGNGQPGSTMTVVDPTGTTTATTATAAEERSRRSSTTSSTTTTTTAPDPASVALGPLLLEDLGTQSPIYPMGMPFAGPLTAESLSAWPMLSLFDVPQPDPAVLPDPDPTVVATLHDEGFEGAFRQVYAGKSFPASATITLNRFTSPDGAVREAQRLYGSLVSTAGSEPTSAAGAPDGSRVIAVPKPAPYSAGTVVVVIFTLGRDQVTVVTPDSRLAVDDAPGSAPAVRLALLQRDRLIELGGGA